MLRWPCGTATYATIDASGLRLGLNSKPGDEVIRRGSETKAAAADTGAMGAGTGSLRHTDHPDSRQANTSAASMAPAMAPQPARCGRPRERRGGKKCVSPC